MKKIELKAGLEIHQQLDTGKLFCRCPSILRNEEGPIKLHRKLHATAGESGKIDAAVKHEVSKDKLFVYEGFNDTNCLVEFDESPPYEIDKEALKITLQLALLLNCEILPITQIMRKTVIDGSNTSGFQRTTLIAKDGFIETSQGRVRIATICLEEDAARIIEQTSEKTIYRLDRLGIPMIEIATYPDIYFPEQVKEAALKIGEILRACKVKRGLGTIRQDVNISIPGSERAEIKGFQEPSIMIKTVELEIERQRRLIEIHEKIKKLKQIEEKIEDLTSLFSNTECKFIKSALQKGEKVLGIKIPNFAGILGEELYEGKRFGSEVSDYAKMMAVGGIIHSDESPEKYNFKNEFNEVRKKLATKDKDSFILIVAQENKAKKALKEAIKRINLQIEKPSLKEVRKSNEDASTSFLRPMPGADRMYPETDLPLLKISRDFINEVRNSLPKLRTEIKGELKTKGLTEEMINLVLESGMLKEFEALLKIYNLPNFVAKLLLILPKEIASHEKLSQEKLEEIFTLDILETILKKIADKKISEEDAKIILTNLAKGKSLEEALKLEKLEISDLESEIVKIVKAKPGLNPNAYMGLVMAKFKSKVSGKEVMNILSKLVK